MRHYHSRRPRASPGVPHRPSPFPAVLNRPLPSTPIPGVPRRPSPLPCTNMSHPVGPAVLPKDGRPPFRAPRTDYSSTASRPVPSGVLGSPPAGPRRAPGGLRTLALCSLDWPIFSTAYLDLPDFTRHFNLHWYWPIYSYQDHILKKQRNLYITQIHRPSLAIHWKNRVENVRCGGNDLRLGFYAAEWNSLGGDTIFVLCGDEDHDWRCWVKGRRDLRKK